MIAFWTESAHDKRSKVEGGIWRTIDGDARTWHTYLALTASLFLGNDPPSGPLMSCCRSLDGDLGRCGIAAGWWVWVFNDVERGGTGRGRATGRAVMVGLLYEYFGTVFGLELWTDWIWLIQSSACVLRRYGNVDETQLSIHNRYHGSLVSS